MPQSQLTAERLQYARSLVAFFIKRGRPEGFTAQLVAQLIHRRSQLVRCLPHFVESGLRSSLHLLPYRRCHLPVAAESVVLQAPRRRSHQPAVFDRRFSLGGEVGIGEQP